MTDQTNAAETSATAATAPPPANGQARRKRTLPAATRAKISRTMKGRRKPAKTRAKISQTLKGHPVSAKARAKISAAMKGRKMPAKTRAKISRTLQGHPVPAATRAKISDTASLTAPHGEDHPSYKHGAYATPVRPIETLEDVIADLSGKQARLSAILDRRLAADDTIDSALLTLLALHSQNAGKLGQLLRYQKAQANTGEDERQKAINEALDELSRELGIKL